MYRNLADRCRRDKPSTIVRAVIAPLRTAKLPPRPALLAALGPGVVWLALAQGSGELIWWPYMVAKYGLWFLFLLVPACLLQWPLNVEIGRYTVLTGETVWQGFFRQSRPLALGLWLLMAASFLWFGGFASAGGEAVASLTGFPSGLSPEGRKLFWGFASVAVSFFALLFSRTVYTLVERVMTVVAAVTVIGLVLACTHPKVVAAVPSFAAGLVFPVRPEGRVWDPSDATKLLTAVSFAGLGGFWTLFYSSWLREKGAGMAAHMGRLTSPITGRGEFIEDSGFRPEDGPDLPERVRSWTRFLWADAGVGVIGNLATTLMTCLLSYALLFPEGLVPTEGQLVTVQARFFEASWGAWGKAAFLLIAAAFLADTWLGTVDAVAHTHTSMIRAFLPRVAAKWTYRRTYYACVVGLTIVTSLTMAAKSPSVLILTSAVIGFAGTVTYSAALLHLNYRVLPRLVPEAAAPPRKGAILMGAVVVVYAGLAVAYLSAVLS
jgi:hypothetical protein